MLNRLRTVANQVVETVRSVAGIRAGIEEPLYIVEPLIDDVEIREYGPRIAAQTTLLAGEEDARYAGFHRLAGYIFGANHGRQKIAMIAPVGHQATGDGGQTIAMTAPVAQQSDGDRRWAIRFYMPASWTLETLPIPDDERVELVAVPPETLAVLRFSGNRRPDGVAARTRQLRQALRATGFEPVGEPAAWFYDPPRTLPFRRRNEIAIPIDRSPSGAH